MSRKPSAALAVVRQYQSESDAIREAPEPRWAQITVLVLASFLLSAIAIMWLTKIDRVLSGAGKIVPTQQVNVYQALDRSLIKTLDVREGELVHTNQLLATLDPTFAAADVDQLELQIASLEALIQRDQAELAGKALVFSPHQTPGFTKYAALQQSLYEQRMAQYSAQLNSFDGKVKQTKATIQKLENDQGRMKEREQIAQKIETMRTTLAEKGVGSQLNLLLSQDSRLEMLRTLENDQNSLIEAQHTLASVTADREAFIQQWSTQVSQELVKARNDLDAARAQLEKAAKRKDLVRLTASEPSVVLSMAKLSVGSVLKDGETLLTLMPANTQLEAEIRIASRDVGFLRANDRCVLKIDAFNYNEHGTAEGKVRWISEGAFTTDDNGQAAEPYYKARCSIEAMEFVNVPPNFRLLPGMTLSADLNVGTRSVGAYLLGGLTRGFNEAMREP